VRLTDYFNCLDTITITEELVQDSDLFFKLMLFATNNQAFTSPCQFETKAPVSGTTPATAVSPTIEQPTWFKPKSFHSLAMWVIVALEENLWAQ
jgi:hypothetical protein